MNSQKNTLHVFLDIWPLIEGDKGYTNGVTPDIFGNFYFLYLNENGDPINNIILKKGHEILRVELKENVQHSMQINSLRKTHPKADCDEQKKSPKIRNIAPKHFIEFPSKYSINKGDFYNITVYIGDKELLSDDDIKLTDILECDPQVQNSPPPHDGGNG